MQQTCIALCLNLELTDKGRSVRSVVPGAAAGLQCSEKTSLVTCSTLRVLADILILWEHKVPEDAHLDDAVRHV